MRRRRWRSGRANPQARLIFIGAAGVAVLVSFIVLVNLGGNAQPARHEVRIELPDAIK